MIYINNRRFGDKFFMNGEVNYKAVELSDDINIIRMRFRDNTDITNMMFAYQYIKEEKPESKVVLHMLYTPYSRMDRAINDQIFSLRLFARILANMNMHVVVVDNHSDVLRLEFEAAGIDFEIDSHALDRFISRAYEISDADVILLPDKGAYAKYGPICARALEGKRPVEYIHGVKTRDLNNKGTIIGYDLVCNGVTVENKKVLIVDDICSFGGTALNAAKALKMAGASEVHFYIAHAELNLFKGELTHNTLFNSIITTDTILEMSDKVPCEVPVIILRY